MNSDGIVFQHTSRHVLLLRGRDEQRYLVQKLPADAPLLYPIILECKDLCLESMLHPIEPFHFSDQALISSQGRQQN